MLNNWYKKEKPIQGMMGMGGGATGYLSGGAAASGPFSATGGNQSGGPSGFPANGFKYHTFTSDGDFVVASGNGTVEVLIVGGGGGGSDYNGPGNAGGGGGAGGLVHHAALAISSGTYPIVVGAGGPDNPSPNGEYIAANGEDSTAFGMVAKGGGGAGGYTSGGRPGGSGGGGGTPGGAGAENIEFTIQPEVGAGKDMLQADLDAFKTWKSGSKSFSSSSDGLINIFFTK